MAELKVLFLHETGYTAEVNPAGSDTLTLPGLATSGPIDVNHNEVLNVATPLLPDSAATKAYVDAVASGLNPHASVIVKTPHELGTYAISVGSGGTWTGALTTGDKFTVGIDGETPVLVTLASAPADRAATIAAINSLYAAGGGLGGTIAVAGAAGQIDIRSNTYGTGSTVAITLADAVWGAQVGIANDTDAGLNFTATGTGVGKTLTAPSTAASFNTIDGVALLVDDRVLVADEGGDDATANLNNGIYKVTVLGDGASNSFTLERTTDADQGVTGELVKGLYVFVVEGTLANNTGWTMTTAGAITVDTTPIVFSQFSGTPGLVWGKGLSRDIDTIAVELDGGADAQGVGYPSGDRKSGLEFDADSVSGQLRVAVAAAGGLQRNQSAGGVEVKLHAPAGVNTLSATADGLRVIGVPEQFYVGTSAVSANVTATNLNTLTGGSDASLLHYHAGASEAARLEYDFTADGGIAKADPVYITAAGKAKKALANSDSTTWAVGIARTAITDTEAGPIVLDGIALSVFDSDQTIGARWFLGATGGLTATAPTGSGKHVMQMGFTCAVRDFLVAKQYFGKKA